MLTSVVLSGILAPGSGGGWEWVPSQEEIDKYRKSWNPFSHGPILHTAVDIQPKGQSLLRPFLFTQIGEHKFDNRFRFVTDRKPGDVHLYSALHPSVEFAYGLIDHIQLGGTSSIQSFWAREQGQVRSDTGIGDTSIAIKYLRSSRIPPPGGRP